MYKCPYECTSIHFLTFLNTYAHTQINKQTNKQCVSTWSIMC